MVAQWSVGVMARRLLCEWGPPRGALVRQADGLPHGRARRPVRWVQKKNDRLGRHQLLGVWVLYVSQGPRAGTPSPPEFQAGLSDSLIQAV